DNDCFKSYFCDLTTAKCVAPQAAGSKCARGLECASAFCVDGFCCNAACTEQCAACNVMGSEGTCSPVAGAPVGMRAACATDMTACGGTCDGMNPLACAYPGAMTQCRAPSCAAGVATLAAACDGKGACPAAQTASCGTYVCGMTGCLKMCAGPGDCAMGSFCSGGGMCLVKQSNGTTCAGAGD